VPGLDPVCACLAQGCRLVRSDADTTIILLDTLETDLDAGDFMV
jgi:hypothetical protein